MYSLTKLSLSTLALAGAAYAQAGISTGGLSVTVPGGPDLWWLAGQPNNLIWTCAQTTYTDFTVWINNSDITLHTAITPLQAIEQNFNCDFLVSGELITMPVGTGYTIVLSDPNNVTNVYASSAEFEIKALSAGYPASSATPTATATVSKGTASNVPVSQTGSGSGTASGSGASQTGKSAGVSTRVGMGAAALVGVAVAAAALF
jgi:hypothetical protein